MLGVGLHYILLKNTALHCRPSISEPEHLQRKILEIFTAIFLIDRKTGTCRWKAVAFLRGQSWNLTDFQKQNSREAGTRKRDCCRGKECMDHQLQIWSSTRWGKLRRIPPRCITMLKTKCLCSSISAVDALIHLLMGGRGTAMGKAGPMVRYKNFLREHSPLLPHFFPFISPLPSTYLFMEKGLVTHSKRLAICKPERGLFLGTLTLDFHTPELGSTKMSTLFLSHPPWSILS